MKSCPASEVGEAVRGTRETREPDERRGPAGVDSGLGMSSSDVTVAGMVVRAHGGDTSGF